LGTDVAAEFIKSAQFRDQFPVESLPEIAFLGRSNVGKSSLLNTLTGVKGLAKTSSTPGRTQLINFFRVDEGFHFVDLPGYGYAQAPHAVVDTWGKMIEDYLKFRQTLKLCLVLLDGRRGWMKKDLELQRWLEFHKRPYMVVATKWDKLNQSEQHHGTAAIRKHFPEGELLPFSALNGRGAREIWQAISKIKT
jgi:GTP-binding protein